MLSHLPFEKLIWRCIATKEMCCPANPLGFDDGQLEDINTEIPCFFRRVQNLTSSPISLY
jgi:hypothetical protein